MTAFQLRGAFDLTGRNSLLLTKELATNFLAVVAPGHTGITDQQVQTMDTALKAVEFRFGKTIVNFVHAVSQKEGGFTRFLNEDCDTTTVTRAIAPVFATTLCPDKTLDEVIVKALDTKFRDTYIIGTNDKIYRYVPALELVPGQLG